MPKADFLAKASPEFQADVECIFQAFKEGGKDKANEVYRRIQIEKKLQLWVAVVLADYAHDKIVSYEKELAVSQPT